MDEQISIDEVRDLHPIFRANPFLIEEGASLVTGEAFLLQESLKRIDFKLTDSKGIPLYAELDWAELHISQIEDYGRLLEPQLREGKARLVWLIPNDLQAPRIQYVEAKRFSRDVLSNLVSLRKKAKDILQATSQALSAPVTVPKGLMGGSDCTFPNIISACYFEGLLITQSGSKKIGLKHQSDGRYLDLTRCIANSSFSDSLPELTILLLGELFRAPYFHTVSPREGTIDESFYKHIYENRKIGYLKPIAGITITLGDQIHQFVQQEAKLILDFYSNDVEKYDLLYRVILGIAPKVIEMGLIDIGKLINGLITAFQLQPVPTVRQIRHGLANQLIENKVPSSDRYERDFAKRLIEIATLKRQLMPVRGVPVIDVLVPKVEGKAVSYTRVPAQNLRLNTDPRLFLPILSNLQIGGD